MKKTATPETAPERFAPHAVVTITPRLLDIEAAAAYLGGVSVSTMRSWIADQLIAPVNLPGVKQSRGRVKKETNRRLLFDRLDLDAFIESQGCVTDLDYLQRERTLDSGVVVSLAMMRADTQEARTFMARRDNCRWSIPVRRSRIQREVRQLR